MIYGPLNRYQLSQGQQMEKHIKILSYMFVVLVVCFLLNTSCTFATTEKSKESINYVHDAIAGINTYHANLIARMYPSAVADNNSKVARDFDQNNFIEIKSTVFGESGKRMKLVTNMPWPESDIEIEIMLVFDGTWLWIQNKTTEHPKMRANQPKFAAMKIHIPSVSPDPVKEPFNTFFGVSGTGLYRDLDLPGTFAEILEDYDFKNTTSLKNSNKLIFKGHRKIDLKGSEMEGVNKELSDLMEKTTQFCKLWVSKETGLILAYSTGQSEERPTIHTEIEYINVNEKLPEDTFKYLPPKGVVVKDITSTILEKKEMMKEKIGK
jgi:outer membrane lipoprotein-sorting protein